MEFDVLHWLRRAGWLKPGLRWPDTLWIAFAVLAIASLAGVICWHVANLSAPQVFMHVDGSIPLAVKNHIRDVNWPDTNWARADLPAYKDNGQYNFSSYNLAFTIFDNLSPFKGPRDLSLLSVLCWMGFIGVMVWSAARTLGLLGASIVAAALIVTPLLVQDSFYGRPESFLTLLTALTFVLSARDRWASQIAASVAAGLGLACKISFAPFVLVTLAAPLLLRGGRGGWRAAASVPAAALGFALGAPGALIEPGAFMEGVEFLRRQYAGYHWPHGSMDEGLIPQVLHSTTYYLATMGPLALVILVAAPASLTVLALKPKLEWSVRAPRLHLLAFCVAAAGTVVFFSIERTFFERNISHAAPILWMAVAWVAVTVSRSGTGILRPPFVRAACLAFVFAGLIPMALMSQRVANVIGANVNHWAGKANAEADRRARETGLPVAVVFSWHERQVWPDLCNFVRAAKGPVMAKLITGTDSRNTPRPVDDRLALFVSVPGPFNDQPLSTLQAYHHAQVEFYVVRPDLKPGDCG